MNVNAYKEYYRNVAIRHDILRHNPASDTANGPVGGRRFTIFSQEDVINSLRSALPTGPVLHLHLYEWAMRDNQAYDQRGDYTGGFMVTRCSKVNDTNDLVLSYSICEQIVNDIINKMILDDSKDCTHAMGIQDFDKLQVVPVGPLWNSRYGWFVTWPFLCTRSSVPDPATVAAAFPETTRIFESQFERQFE